LYDTFLSELKPGHLEEVGFAEMKVTDDYRAKVKLWVSNPAVVSALPPPKLPKFSPKKFSNHSEMNEWKSSLLRQLAREIKEDG
jgi:hypothetical protein